MTTEHGPRESMARPTKAQAFDAAMKVLGAYYALKKADEISTENASGPSGVRPEPRLLGDPFVHLVMTTKPSPGPAKTVEEAAQRFIDHAENLVGQLQELSAAGHDSDVMLSIEIALRVVNYGYFIVMDEDMPPHLVWPLAATGE